MKKFIVALVAGAACCCSFGQEQPNIIVIMADDMGYSDLGCYGSEIQTPNLDALAEDGILFTQFYNAARCCPSRASILTGLYPHQAGVGAMTGNAARNEDLAAYQGYLRSDCVTLGEVLKLNGYYTMASGKWHVGDSLPEMMPQNRGFDRSFFTPSGAGSYYNSGWADGKPRLCQVDGKKVMPWDGFFDTDAVFDFSIRFIRERPAAPFFAYVTPKAPHWPLHARAADIKKYKGVYDGGWDEIRARRVAKQRQLGLISKDWKSAPRSDGDGVVPVWKDLSKKKRHEMADKMEVYAAQVDCLDQNVGRLVTFLKAEGVFENTLILFLSDNGACAEPNDQPFGEDWKEGKGGPVGSATSFESGGRGWAEVSNTPFRLWKWKAHEGGTATPLIASWPLGISKKGSVSRQSGHIVDVMATCLDLCDGEYPARLNEQKIQPLEGISFAPVFQGLEREEHAVIGWEHFANRGIRCGKWKLVSQTHDHWKNATPGAWELYNLEDDRTEMNDLVKRMPEKAQEMAAQYAAWAARAGVVDDTAEWRKR